MIALYLLAAAGALTLTIHLLNRGRAMPLPFGDIRFVPATAVRHFRLGRLRQRMLLFLRVLLLGLLALWLYQALSGQLHHGDARPLGEPGLLRPTPGDTPLVLEDLWTEGVATAPAAPPGPITLQPAPLPPLSIQVAPDADPRVHRAVDLLAASGGIPLQVCRADACRQPPDVVLTAAADVASGEGPWRVQIGAPGEGAGDAPVRTGIRNWSWAADLDDPTLPWQLQHLLDVIREHRPPPAIGDSRRADSWPLLLPILILLAWVVERLVAGRHSEARSNGR